VPPADSPHRRSFLEQAAAFTLGGCAILAPLGAAIASVLTPIWRPRKSGPGYVKVASKEVADRLRPGVPELFNVMGVEQNAWNSFPDQPLGSVYLIKDDAGKIQAFQSICPHQGCQVEFHTQGRIFYCPCHGAGFSSDGKRTADDAGPKCRDLDALPVKVEADAVLVEYKRFQSGVMEKRELP
jgi:Rieske Fe-S protein